MKKQLTLFFTALTFYTRIPCYSLSNFTEEYINKASRYFPLVGWIVGAFGAIIYILTSHILPHSIAILLSILSIILITGAFHEDGLADFCDGFGGGNTKEQILTIMKDSRTGSYGVIGVIMILALKYFSLFEIKHSIIPLALIASNSISRFTAISFMYTHDYARKNDSTSKSPQVAQKAKLLDIIIAAIISILPVILLGYIYLLALIPIFIIREIMGFYFNKKINGYTGDSLGAVQQITEITFYIFILLIQQWKFT